MSKAITSCKKALAYLLTAAMVLGMAVTSPITAETVKATVLDYKVLAAESSDNYTIAAEQATSYDAVVNGIKNDADLTITVTPKNDYWIKGFSASAAGMETQTVTGGDGNWASADKSLSKTIQAAALGTLGSDITVRPVLTQAVKFSIDGSSADNLDGTTPFEIVTGRLGKDNAGTANLYIDKNVTLQFKLNPASTKIIDTVKVGIDSHPDTSGFSASGGALVEPDSQGVYEISAADLKGDVTVFVTAVDEKELNVTNETGWTLKYVDGTAITSGDKIGTKREVKFIVDKTEGVFDPDEVKISADIKTNEPVYVEIPKGQTDADSDHKSWYDYDETLGKYVYHIGTTASDSAVTDNVFIKVEERTKRKVILSDTAAELHATVKLEGSGDYISSDASACTSFAITNKDILFNVTPAAGYTVTKVKASLNGSTTYTEVYPKAAAGESSLNEMTLLNESNPAAGETWKLKIDKTRTDSSTLTDNVMIHVDAIQIPCNATVNLTTDDNNSPTIGDYVTIKKIPKGGTVTSASVVDTGVYGIGKGDTVVIELKDLRTAGSAAAGALAEPTITAEKTAANDDGTHDAVTLTAKEYTEGSPGYWTYKIENIQEAVTLKVSYKYRNTVKINKVNVSAGTGVAFSTNSSYNVKDNEATVETYRVKEGEKPTITVSPVAPGSTVTVTAKNKNGEALTFENNPSRLSSGAGAWTLENAIAAGSEETITFEVKEVSSSFEIENISDAGDGYKIKYRTGTGEFTLLNNGGKISVPYGTKVDFQILDKTDKIIQASGLQAAETLSSSNVRLECTMGGADKSVLLKNTTGDSGNYMYLTQVTGDVKIGARNMRVDVVQNKTHVMDADRDLAIVYTDGTPIGADGYLKFGQEFKFDVRKVTGSGEDAVYSKVTDPVRISYAVSATTPAASAYAVLTADTVTGLYKLADTVTGGFTAADQKLYVRAEYLYPITVNVGENITVTNATTASYQFVRVRSDGTKTTIGTAAALTRTGENNGVNTINTTLYDFTNGGAATDTYALRILATPKGSYKEVVKVGDGAALENNGTAYTYDIPLNALDTDGVAYKPGVYSIPEEINITASPLKKLTVTTTKLSPNFAVTVVDKKKGEAAKDVTPSTAGAGVKVYEVSLEDTYIVTAKGNDASLYTLSTKPTAPVTGITNMYTLDLADGEDAKYEISEITADASLTFTETYNAAVNVTVDTGANIAVRAYGTKYYPEDSRDPSGRWGYQENFVDIAASNTGTNVSVSPGYADIRIKAEPSTNYKVDKITLTIGTGNEAAIDLVKDTTDSSGKTYIVDKDLLDYAQTNTIKVYAAPDENSYFNVDFAVGKNANVKVAAGEIYTNGNTTDGSTALTSDTTTTILSADKTVTFTVEATTGKGYQIKDVKVNGAYITKTTGAPDSYTVTFADRKEAGAKATVTVETEPEAIENDVYVKIVGKDHLRYEVLPAGSEYSKADGIYKMSGSTNELTLKVYVEKGYKAGTITDTTSSSARVGTSRELVGNEWLYTYTINGSKIEAQLAGSSPAAGDVHTITLGNPVAETVKLTNAATSATYDIGAGNIKYDGTNISGGIAQGSYKSGLAAGKEVVVQIPNTMKLLVDGVDITGQTGYVDDSTNTPTRSYTFTADLKDDENETETNYDLELVARTDAAGYTWKLFAGANSTAATEVEIPENGIVTFEDGVTPDPAKYFVRIYKIKADSDEYDLFTNKSTNKIYPVNKKGELGTVLTTASGNKYAEHEIAAADVTSEVSYSYKEIETAGDAKKEIDIPDKTITIRRNGKPEKISSENDEKSITVDLDKGKEKAVTVKVLDTNGNQIEKPVVTLDHDKDESGKISAVYDKETSSLKITVDESAEYGASQKFTATINGALAANTPADEIFEITVNVKKAVKATKATISGTVPTLKIGGDSAKLTITKIEGTVGEATDIVDITDKVADDDITVTSKNNNVTLGVENKVITIAPRGIGDDEVTIVIGDFTKTYNVKVKSAESSSAEEVSVVLYGTDDGNDEPPVITVTRGKSIDKTVLDGYVNSDANVEGWYKDAAFRKQWKFDTDVFNDDVTSLYAKTFYVAGDSEVENDYITISMKDWYEYTGSKIVPTAVVKRVTNGVETVIRPSKKTYTVAYDTAVNACDDDKPYKATFTFYDDYKKLVGGDGTIVKPFVIVQSCITDNIKIAGNRTGLIQGAKAKPITSVKGSNGKTLKESEYKIKVYDPEGTEVATSNAKMTFDKEGTYKIEVTGDGVNYECDESKPWEIEIPVAAKAKHMKNAKVTIAAQKVTEANDFPVMPEISVKLPDGTTATIAKGEYDSADDKVHVAYEYNDKVGKATAQIEADGFIGYINKTFQITANGTAVTAANIFTGGKETAKKIKALSIDYTGYGITLDKLAKDNKLGIEDLIKEEYVDSLLITYKNNIKAGTATMTIAGKPDSVLKGKFTQTFKIDKVNFAEAFKDGMIEVYDFSAKENDGVIEITKAAFVKTNSRTGAITALNGSILYNAKTRDFLTYKKDFTLVTKSGKTYLKGAGSYSLNKDALIEVKLGKLE